MNPSQRFRVAVWSLLLLAGLALIVFVHLVVPYVAEVVHATHAPQTDEKEYANQTVVAGTPVDSDGDGETDYYCVDNVDCGNDTPRPTEPEHDND